MFVDGQYFKDEQGRILLLRGINLGGSTKVPSTPNGASYIRDGFFDHRTVSFVGRPFPLEEADEHYTRLKTWGFNFLRFLITWEAVEHAGPGQYDTAYLDYLYAVVQKAAEYGFDVFIDPHQDVWSRWTGGDGAPGWTLEAVGFDLTKLDAAGAAITHQMHGDPFPRMVWPTNYGKLGAATMFTLFFAGQTFAPDLKIDGVNIQEYLQSHYLNAMRQVARRLHGLPNVVGWDAINEPGSGWIGMADLNTLAGVVAFGASPTAYQAMVAGAGYPQEVAVSMMGTNGIEEIDRTTINPDGVSVWCDGCIWKKHGVWADDGGTPRLLRPDYFAQGDFIQDYFKPFLRRFIASIRDIDPDAILFIEGVPGGRHPDWSAADAPNAVNAAHWYDGVTLFTKTFNPEFTIDFTTREMISGRDNVRASFARQLGAIKEESAQHMGGIPTLIGEFGLPFDMDEKAAYKSGDFSLQTQALDAYYSATEAHWLHSTLWNYTADNNNARGDNWNDEDLSVFSRDQQTDPADINSGGRALAAFIRPYARKVAGEPVSMAFDLETRTFTFSYRPADLSAPTEIFVPEYQYPAGYNVEVSSGVFHVDRAAQTVTIQHARDSEIVNVTVRPG